MITATRGKERVLTPHELLVSKTDLKGRILYANAAFCRVAGYSAEELRGKAHSIVRHPDMPRCVFGLLWDTIRAGEEIFAYVKNLASNGDYYWVFAHVTPTFDDAGRPVGYHSNRRAPRRSALPEVVALYQALSAAEADHRDARAAVKAGLSLLDTRLQQAGMTYAQYVFSLAT